VRGRFGLGLAQGVAFTAFFAVLRAGNFLTAFLVLTGWTFFAGFFAVFFALRAGVFLAFAARDGDYFLLAFFSFFTAIFFRSFEPDSPRGAPSSPVVGNSLSTTGANRTLGWPGANVCF